MDKEMTMEELMSDFELKNFHKGEIVKGKVVSVKNDEIVVNIGHFADGIIPKNEISNDDEFDINSLSIDDIIYVMVLSGDDGDGNVLLSKKRADKEKTIENIERSFEENKLISVKVKEVIKGGLSCDANGVKVFMPASQCSIRRIENFNTLLGKSLDVKVIEFEKRNNKIVVSRRVVEETLAKEEKERIWNSIKSGEKRQGVVTKLVKFGAFVDIGGVNGLIHLNDMSWSRVNKPEDVVSVGDNVEVFVQEVDKSKGRISLSLKDILQNPWDNIKTKYKVNDVLDGVVSKFIKVGAFVEIEPGVEGFVHISEITDENISKPSDALEIGKKVKVKILDINSDENKIALSIKDAIEKSKEYMQYNDENEGFCLGELFKDFKFTNK
ncbi:MAG: 30S ribosomal protein S1 [Sarcina ventriculi]|uniref:30S ribosomal protein S1 n=1 Tax=Sarcina ventriculi TaxID=1267 RepID=UPI00073EA233|nr:30S ribosomal protein S1 [Sarcina ventriculi]MCI5636553.1 30S ribosomal protein S1 [Sarcina ventriculi]MDY7062939.1 30S ribosomal protein S1 [Sarcina ventriculi]